LKDLLNSEGDRQPQTRPNGHARNHQPEPWLDRGEMLSSVTAALAADSCSAVFIVGDPGLGASTLLAQVHSLNAARTAVLPVYGSPSLKSVPYGALSPYLSELSVEDVASKLAVLRALWKHLERVRMGPEPALLLVDDAHDLDSATAEMITDLVQAGWAKAIATCTPSPGIPAPLMRLWHDGTAERFDLAPLTAEQGHELCEALLGGKVLNSTSRSFWAEAGGNTLLFKTLVREAQRSGHLVQRRGIWLSAGSAPARTAELTAVIKVQLMRISADGREALNLLALAQPIERSLVAGIVGEAAVQELLQQSLVTLTGDNRSELRLVSPIYGEVLRRLVPAARSLQLHRELIDRMGFSPDNPESLLRLVSWSLDCGADVPGELKIRAAILACKLFENDTALRIAWAVQEPDLLPTARAVMARSHFNMGHYVEAAQLLGQDVDQRAGLAHVLFGSLLRSATRAALGQPPSEIVADADQLLELGKQQAELHPEQEAAVLSQVATRSSLIKLMALSLAGDYRGMDALLDSVLATDARAESSDGVLATALAFALQSERLCALGFPLRGRQLAIEAFALKQAPENDIFFLPEFIIVRQLCCELAAGNWQEAEQLLSGYADSSGPAMVSFSGAAYVVLGFIAVRQGRLDDALDLLATGLEALRDSDPQQMFRLCAAMAFYVAATLQRAAEAESFRADYEAWGERGMYLVTAHARDYFAAGLERLNGDGQGIAALYRNADLAAAQDAPLLELSAMVLALDLGDKTRLEKLRVVARATEGQWAEAIAQYAEALLADSPELYLAAGRALLNVSAFRLALDAFTEALNPAGRSRGREVAAAARLGMARCNETLGNAGQDQRSFPAAPKLTKREQIIVALAATGLSDRSIADQLQISVRTVEGHLYRCYLKLGIGGRDELARAAGVGAEPLPAPQDGPFGKSR
jgi:DNA-binding CsgD family transcriptional regulator